MSVPHNVNVLRFRSKTRQVSMHGETAQMFRASVHALNGASEESIDEFLANQDRAQMQDGFNRLRKRKGGKMAAIKFLHELADQIERTS